MKQYLKCYQVVMHAIGPVFVGSGREIGKKEYVLLGQGKVGIPDIQRLYGELARRKKGNAFEAYLLGYDNRTDLTTWLGNQNIKARELGPLLRYTLDGGDALSGRGDRRMQVMACIKDPYGNPYIPGSSLKGMFRTILLGADILKNPGKYQQEKKDIRNGGSGGNRNFYLQREIKSVEAIAYRTLGKDQKKPADAVNDWMQGLILGDSEPLSTKDLTLCQKVDLHVDGRERKLPLLRECVKPGARIRFTITVDTSLCNLTEQTLREAVRAFGESYYGNFSSAFSVADRPGERDVFCGGGCGFVSKTVVYPMYGKKEGIAVAKDIFGKTGVPRQHGHDKDDRHGVSPHMLKCTRYQGKLLQMGLCRIDEILPLLQRGIS